MRRPSVCRLGILSLLVLTGCAAGQADGTGPRVAAAFYPYAYVAERVAGEHVDVVNLTSPGVEPHDLELTPQQVADISEADLVIYQAGFQAAVDDAVDQNPPEHALDITDVVDLEDTRVDDAPTADSGDSSDHVHTDLSGDPHVWLDPTLVIPIAELVADELAEVDPEHAADFRANAQDLVADLTRLDQEFTRGLADCERNDFVTSHAAFGYLAHRYGLEMIPIAGLTPDVEPSPQQLAEIRDLVAQTGITTVFSEALGSKEYADTLADDLDVETAILDPIEGLADEDSDADYLSLMRDNLASLKEANGCS